MADEKWVVVTLDSYDTVDETYGIFSSEHEAEAWAKSRYYSFSGWDVQRIKLPEPQEWA